MPRPAVVASLSVALATTPDAARSAAPPATGSDDHEPSEAVLTRLREVAQSRGYDVSTGASALIGTHGGTMLEARCAPGHVEILLLEAGGAAVRVTFDRGAGQSFALEIVGEYPALGTVSRTAIRDDARAVPRTGSLIFAADAGTGLVFIEFGLRGEVVSASGDADAGRINALFARALNSSAIWKDAHVLGFAAAGTWDASMGGGPSELDRILGLAIPALDPAASKAPS